MGCCGIKNKSAQLEYRVTTKDGTVKTVKTMDEVRITLAAGGGGGSYRSVPVTSKPETK